MRPLYNIILEGGQFVFAFEESIKGRGVSGVIVGKDVYARKDGPTYINTTGTENYWIFDESEMHAEVCVTNKGEVIFERSKNDH